MNNTNTQTTQQTSTDNNPNKYPVYPTPTEQDTKTNPYGEH